MEFSNSFTVVNPRKPGLKCPDRGAPSHRREASSGSLAEGVETAALGCCPSMTTNATAARCWGCSAARPPHGSRRVVRAPPCGDRSGACISLCNDLFGPITAFCPHRRSGLWLRLGFNDRECQDHLKEAVEATKSPKLKSKNIYKA